MAPIPSLEYLARSAFFEAAIRKNRSRYRKYIVAGEHIDQYADVIDKKFRLIKTHRLAIDMLLVMIK